MKKGEKKKQCEALKIGFLDKGSAYPLYSHKKKIHEEKATYI